ncbi:MAG: cytochrome c3 family protein [Thermodesulfobacteriota bacterium]|nr:cytochrome c3 family protein [Thermodesulfobacteriota bacterium]
MSAESLAKAPGDTGIATTCTNSCHVTLLTPDSVGGNPLATGCQGCHLEPKHHAPQQAADAPALEVNGWFRFLSGHTGGTSGSGYGVEGIEDADWQYTTSTTDHNEYLGNVGEHDTGNGGMQTLGNTMTGYCTGCHGNFHLQLDAAVGGNWIRHPSDAVIPDSGEYASYTSYNPIAPAARPDLSGYTGPSATVSPGTDLVMCLSCHRAHGSPYDDLLRWEYDGMVAGGGGTGDGTGCFVCHTEKDG